MKNNRPSLRAQSQKVEFATAFFGDAFDQDTMTDRYARARDRAVVEKSRHQRKKPKRYPGLST